MREAAFTTILLASFILVLAGCAENSRHQSGFSVPPSLDDRQPAGSPLVPGAIPPAHATDTLPGEPPGSGLTKPN